MPATGMTAAHNSAQRAFRSPFENGDKLLNAKKLFRIQSGNSDTPAPRRNFKFAAAISANVRANMRLTLSFYMHEIYFLISFNINSN
ncbi:MAG: hypothetical protein DBX55_02365 [Verrucomicrobia bacterium]|nr:MAG: hypothetical protein DBX55_02365 [Verrucomicrobiota bacterium]